MTNNIAKINGIMLDPARTLQPLSYYRRMFEYFADWGINTVLLHLTDDQGCAIKLKTLGNAASKGAWGKRECDQLIGWADKLHLELIPEVEAFGHTRYILDLPQFRHLRDDSGKSQGGGELYSGINPCHPQTLELFEKIFSEVCELFPGRYLHIGCDEVDFGHSPEVVKVLKRKPKWFVYADYVNRAARVAKGFKREILFWADHVVREPETLTVLDKDLIAVDWYYWPIKPVEYQKRIKRLIDAGLRVISSPSLACSDWALHAGPKALETTQNLSAGIHCLGSDRMLGLINTVWCPSRFIPDMLWHEVAASSRLASDPETPLSTIDSEFVRRFFGVKGKPSKVWQILIRSFYNASFPLTDLAWQCWHSPETQAESLLHPDPVDGAWDESIKLASELRKTVTRNKNAFDTLVLTFKLRKHLDWRRLQLRRPKPAFALLARKDQAMVKRFLRVWKQYYVPSHPAKAPLRFNPKVEENLYAVLCSAAEFTRRLAKKKP